ncbi:MAG: LuxR C-terminal-related transcriptional regulator [Candidatus Omnitrophica bacterium]|nr:LuxR C-terminal-related transcriptional regulator [Candidatus Omnitrophota bacterium]MDD5352275.1 LuxR C-terminal-related transcriptional regulator [Candidatus Omnitrophota bacterium]MDD5549874.1 LuxR C-terminal-related transcriptional regulator [Candidatus Omnitrophota bacterium]
MTKIINLCPVCGGKGKFLTQTCPTCNGKGGELSKFDKEVAKILDSNLAKLNEQEKEVCELYKTGFSQKEIAKKMDITPAKVASIFYQIEKKLNQ